MFFGLDDDASTSPGAHSPKRNDHIKVLEYQLTSGIAAHKIKLEGRVLSNPRTSSTPTSTSAHSPCTSSTTSPSTSSASASSSTTTTSRSVSCTTSASVSTPESETEGVRACVMKALTSPQAVTSLTTVELTSCFLVEIPPELAGLRALTSLFLPKNKISVIPDWIVQLPSLKNLEVNYNCIRHVTSSLGEVASLEKLSLVHNKLREFPFEQLGWLPNIQSAFLGLNYLDLTKLSEQERQLSDALCPNISMQRCPQLIIPGLYLGGVITTEDAEELQALGITHILSIGMSPLCGNLPAFAFKKVAVNDLPHEDIKSHFPAANGFISQGIATGGVLVHCAAGQSRSPSFVVAYLMASKRMPYSMALSLVRQKRPCCSPNFGFCKQLQQYAKSLAL